MIYDLGYWRVLLTNRDKHQEIIQAIYSNMKSKRSKFVALKSSRLYIMNAEGAVFETWLCVDEFADEKDRAENIKAQNEDTLAVDLRKRWESLIVSGSFKKEMWTEFTPDIWI
jgi:hypothetical protein